MFNISDDSVMVGDGIRGFGGLCNQQGFWKVVEVRVTRKETKEVIEFSSDSRGHNMLIRAIDSIVSTREADNARW